LAVISHFPGRNIFDVLTNNGWEDEKGRQKFEKVHALFFCPIYTEIVNHDKYDDKVSFQENYKRLRGEILSVYCKKEERLIFSSTKYSTPDIAEFKSEVLENLYELSKIGTIKRENNFDELLNVVVEDVVNIKLKSISKAKEFSISQRVLESFKRKYLKAASKFRIVSEYLDTYCEKMLKKNLKKNIRDAKFGSYKFSVGSFLDKGILIRLSDYDVSQKTSCLSGICFILSCNVPNQFTVEMCILDVVVTKKDFVFDQLLLKKYKGERVIHLENLQGKKWMAELAVDGLVRIINKSFIE